MATFRDFLSSGRLGAVRLGMTPQTVERLWGRSDDQSVQRQPTEIVRYGSIELVFKAATDTDDTRLIAATIYFGKPNQQLPAAARFEDWSPTDLTTEAEFREFVNAANLQLHSKVDGHYTHLVLASGASAVLDDGHLHSVRYRRADELPRRKQTSVSLPETTLRQLRARAEREHISLQELIERVLLTAP